MKEQTTFITAIVLILILMEHAQRVEKTKMKPIEVWRGLNPYFNGTCSKRKTKMKPIEVWRVS